MAERCRDVIDADIAKYFDRIEHDQLRKLLDLRIKDGVIRRIIDKWLKAGMLDRGMLKRNELGTPQGGVLSPCLSNLYLHRVLDRGHEQEVKLGLRGRSRLVWSADDLVLWFECKPDAQRVLEVLDKRFGRSGLTRHPTQTRFLDFCPPPGKGTTEHGNFDLLRFARVWGTSRKGDPVLRQVTSKRRFARAVKTVYPWCSWNRHRLLHEQQQRLSRVIRVHCACSGMTGNAKRLFMFRDEFIRGWRKALSRRSRDGKLSWEKMNMLSCQYPLAPARVMRSIHAT